MLSRSDLVLLSLLVCFQHHNMQKSLFRSAVITLRVNVCKMGSCSYKMLSKTLCYSGQTFHCFTPQTCSVPALTLQNKSFSYN